MCSYYLSGPKKGKSEMFSENLPGLPDNLSPSSDGGYWLALALPRYEGVGFMGFDINTYASTRPWIRRLVAKVCLLFTSHYALSISSSFSPFCPYTPKPKFALPASASRFY